MNLEKKNHNAKVIRKKVTDKIQKGSVFTYEYKLRLGINIKCKRQDPNPISK